MLYLAGLWTFLAVALALAGLLHFRSRSRLEARLLADRDPLEQAATRIQLPSLLQSLERDARQAGLEWSRRFFLLLWSVGLASGLVLLLSGDPLLGLAIPAAVVVLPLLLIRYRSRQRAEQFAVQLPTALTLMANVIRAGGSLLHAVSAVARQMPDPIRSEFVLVRRAMQLRVPPAEAMARVRDRIGLSEFVSVVVACKVAGDAGADLDQVFESIARELVEDRQFLKVMQGASAEGRTSAKMVTGVPFGILAMIAFLNPSHLKSSLQDTSVLLLYGVALAMMAVGWTVIRRITDVRNW